MKQLLMMVLSAWLLVMELRAEVLATERVYLSGQGPSDARSWDFFCTKGRNSGVWTTIPVPSNWEQHGFGGYNYGHDKNKHDEEGWYRCRFQAPEIWHDRIVRIVFEGSMTDTEVKINGKLAGPIHQGAWYEFSYPISDLLQLGQENLLEVKVAKKSANESLEDAERVADFWVHGGIFRPVYLEVLPTLFIDRVAIDARADGQFQIDVLTGGENKTAQISAQIETLDGQPVGAPLEGTRRDVAEPVRLTAQINQPRTWSDEQPDLYRVRVTLKVAGQPVHELITRFGFRTFEVRPGDGLYLNDKKMIIRGINRNTFRPKTGRALDAQDDADDARAMKAMHVNLVRSHVSPTKAFMDQCDELGLFLINELCTWQKPHIETPLARKLIQEMVARDVNHPSLLMWANGNEGGFNLEVDGDYALHDPQRRPVIHPWAFFGDIDTAHYRTYAQHVELLKGPNVYLPTEFLHGLYDGGHGAGLEDYWNAIRASTYGAGGVLWCWEDAALVRTDQEGRLDTYGNKSADGIVGPYGEKEASYFTAQTIWAPIQTTLDQIDADFNGHISLRNEYAFTDLKQCTFEWRLLNYSGPLAAAATTTVIQSAAVAAPEIAPGQTGMLALKLPANWRANDALELIAHDPHGLQNFRRVWPLTRSDPLKELQPVKLKTEDHLFTFTFGRVAYRFSPETGRLLEATLDGQPLGFANGPIPFWETPSTPAAADWKVAARREGDAVAITARSAAGASDFTWIIKPSGVVELHYQFSLPREKQNYWGVRFDLDESAVRAKRWRGDGPYRIWNNRRKGPAHGLWENNFNRGLAGEVWELPEFSGIFAHVDWMRIDLNSGAHLLLIPDEGTRDIGVLRPPNSTLRMNASWAYPAEGGLFAFHKVPAVGDKFKKSELKGPQSEPQTPPSVMEGKLRFFIQPPK